jgi:hypothetical protein
VTLEPEATPQRDGQFVFADDAFVRWADRILNRVRRNWTHYDSFMYESPTAVPHADV